MFVELKLDKTKIEKHIEELNQSNSYTKRLVLEFLNVIIDSHEEFKYMQKDDFGMYIVSDSMIDCILENCTYDKYSKVSTHIFNGSNEIPFIDNYLKLLKTDPDNKYICFKYSYVFDSYYIIYKIEE